jgi:hypothetical protein
VSAATDSSAPGAPDSEAFDLGDRVLDREDDDPDEAVVVNRPPVAAEEWTVFHENGEEVTVADDNPGYDPKAEVIVVAFAAELEDAHPAYDADEPLALAEAECYTYAFPPGRLERVDDTDPEALLGEDMSALRERLEDAGADVTVERDGRDAVLLVEKLGREHRITADGEVSGPLAGRLSEVVDEYLGGERS